jgi:recombination protein RecR
MEELKARLQDGTIKEVILGLNPDLEGETTALYLVRLLQQFGVNVTKLARGLPTGSEIEYADDSTLSSALKNRRQA